MFGVKEMKLSYLETRIMLRQEHWTYKYITWLLNNDMACATLVSECCLSEQSVVSCIWGSSHQAGPGDIVNASVSSERVPILQSDHQHTDLPEFPCSLRVAWLCRGRLLFAVTAHTHKHTLTIGSGPKHRYAISTGKITVHSSQNV
jgi:hypothetical protein